MSENTGYECSLEDLGMAYRKTKVDLFYASRVCAQELCDFEENLYDNLKKIQEDLANGLAPAVPEGSWTLVPKTITPQENPDLNFVISDPKKKWKLRTDGETPTAEFRIMEFLPIAFHVFATLWVHKVGQQFDRKLGSAAQGNRLRRKKNGDLNLLSMGTTTPYLRPYCHWRDSAMNAIQDGLDKKKPIVTIIADVCSFYHRLDPSFMLDSEFMEKIGIRLDEEAKEEKLHRLFIESLVEWGMNTPLGKGLPVGLTASSLIANVALFELDGNISKEIVPLHYGRYVDDIILVMENTSDFKKPDDVWEWICSRISSLHLGENTNSKETEVTYSPGYLAASDVRFSNKKNKIFLLSGETGEALLTSIRRQICERTSEWRALPDFSRSETQLEANLVTAIQADGEPAGMLSKSDSISIRRASFALKIRDIEAYHRALPAQSWSDLRHRFLDAFIRHILVLPDFFDFFGYLPRMIHLACSCGDFLHFWKIVKALEAVLDALKECDANVAGRTEQGTIEYEKPLLEIFTEELERRVHQSIQASFPFKLSDSQQKNWESLKKSRKAMKRADASVLFDGKGVITKLQEQHHKFFISDLAHLPFKKVLLPTTTSPNTQQAKCITTPQNILLRPTQPTPFLASEVTLSVENLSEISSIILEKDDDVDDSDDKDISGLLFPTRPLNVHELYLLHEAPFSDEGSEDISTCLLGFRGFDTSGYLPSSDDSQEESAVITVSLRNRKVGKLRIAVTSWKTERNSWTASVVQKVDPDYDRLQRIYQVINTVIKSKVKPDYLIFPELSIPAHWFVPLSLKLQVYKIGLIAGIEYQHGKSDLHSKIVRSQIWSALHHDALGFPTIVIYKQDKQTPAFHEEEKLFKTGGRRLEAMKKWRHPPIVNHGGFHFSLLLCSELTNIAYRTALRGKIDALVVPEWNQDIAGFNSLVESAALDIHAFIVQCNDRAYGDSRIRAPYKKGWARDIVQIRGGLEDYFVVGEIDVHSLRQFQSSHRSGAKPFKPVPDGFEMSEARKILPK